METPIGKVTHYYGKPGVAVVELSSTLKIGDQVKIQDKAEAWSQEITSMEVNRTPVSEAGAGDEVAVKIDRKAHEGALIVVEQ